MPIAIKRYKDGSYTPLNRPLSRRMDYQAEGYEAPVSEKKKKPGIVRRYASKILDNAANGLIRGTGNKPMY